MAILIDGYNLLHASGVAGRGRGPGWLERSRRALLNFLAASLDDEQRARTTVVFDAKCAPPDLPRQVTHRGLTVCYAAEHEEADDLIEELIRREPTPKKLTVVSSDSRLQRAARRRRAAAVDSEAWCAELLRRRRRPASDEAQGPSPEPIKGQQPLSEEEVRWWLEQFDIAEQALQEDEDAAGLENPFPPGYGEDVES